MKKKFKGIKMQFLSIFLVITLMILSIIGSVIGYQVIEQAKKDYLNNSNEQMKTVNSSISIFYDAIDKNINMLASNLIITKADNSITTYKNNVEGKQMTPSKNGGIEQEIYEIFKQYGESHKGTLYVYLATKDSGYIQWPEASADKNYDPVKRNWYQNAVSGNGAIIRTPPYVDSVTNNMISSNVRSITDKNGNILGVIGIDVEQTVISDMLKSMKVGQTGFYMLIHSTGVVMADGKNPENNFKQVKELNIGGMESVLSNEGKLIDVKINSDQYVANSRKIQGSDLTLVSFISKSELMASALRTTYIMIIISVIMLIIAFILIGIVTNKITIPIIKASEYLDIIAKGDFSGQIDSKYLLRKDEIGIIINGIYDMKNSLIELINKIKHESSVIDSKVNNVKNNMNVLNESLEEISATTEELSAGMEETSAASQEMLAASQEIKKSVKLIAEKSEDGAKSAGEISERARVAKDNFNISQGKSYKIFISTKEQLEKAMEKSKIVGQINVLAESIMDITEQTNLLALNAAIEASRAGEVGKGFAVVADEIKKLAEQSKDTVSKIQDITLSVTDAVSKLSISSNDLLNFMSTNVNNDYDIMIEVAEQYDKDAEFMNELVTEFKNTSEKLEDSIGGILFSIDGVAQSASEGANGTVDIANQIYNLNNKSNEVVEQILKTKESADKLKSETARFILE